MPHRPELSVLGLASQVAASFVENGIEPVSDIAYRKNAAAFVAQHVPQAAEARRSTYSALPSLVMLMEKEHRSK